MLEFVPTTVQTEATARSSAAVDVILDSMEVTVVRVSTKVWQSCTHFLLYSTSSSKILYLQTIMSSYKDTSSEPPVLEISAMNGTEDRPISIYISAHTAAGSSAGLIIRITKFPSGCTFNTGNFDGQIWILEPAYFGRNYIILPLHSSGLFEITAEAAYVNALHGRVGTVQFTIEAIADAPTLYVMHSPCFDSAHVVFMISSSLADSDGSETLTVVVSGLPTGSQLSLGQIDEEGNYILAEADLQRTIQAIIPSISTRDKITINFTASATEMANNHSASTNASVSINKCRTGTHSMQ